jgi:CP family cyanate transporter-like MFS transporter
MDAIPDQKAAAGDTVGSDIRHDRDQRPMRGILWDHAGWTVAAVLLLGFNLRPAITTVALYITEIKRDFGLSAAGVSVLTMAPVVCLGVFAPAAPALARRFGTEWVVLAALVGIAVGCFVRSFGVVPLYVGTLLIGASMCFVGVLTPAIVKRDFPGRIGLMMGLYTMLVCVGPALATATAIPLQRALGVGWEIVLLLWGLPALAAAVVFIPQLRRNEPVHGASSAQTRDLLRDPLAWQVTLFFGLISSLAYAVFNWGPTMLQARGLDAATSGVVVSVTYLAQMVAGLLAPIVAGRYRDQRLAITVVVLLTAAGLLGYVFAPVWSLSGFSVVLGLGQGGAFGIALLLFALRAGDPQTAAQLSALAQTVGYVVSALVGPFAVGMIHDWSGSWPVVAVFYSVVGLASLLAGLGAGRARTVQVRTTAS